MSVEELEFSVTYVSSIDEDNETSYRNLLTTKPWISSKYCNYPQEVVLRFIHKVNIERIDILCDDQLIPQEMDLYMGNSRVGEKISMNKAEYERLGSISLQGEKGKNELQSVHVDANGWFLKLMIYENYKSRQNKYNQVSLIEISAVGYIIPEEASDISDDDSFEAIQRRSRAYRNEMDKSDSGSQSEIDDSFGSATGATGLSHGNGFPTSGDKSYVDEMRNVLKAVEKEKKLAVNSEKFEYAKKLKVATTKLKLGIEEIDKLERDKREAIEEEDFDKALDCKEEILAIRSSTYADIELQRILSDEQKIDIGLMPRPKKHKPSKSRSRPGTASSKDSRGSPTRKEKQKGSSRAKTPTKLRKVEKVKDQQPTPIFEVSAPTPEPEVADPEKYDYAYTPAPTPIVSAESNNIYDQPSKPYENAFERKENMVLPAVQKKIYGGPDSAREPSPEPEEYIDPSGEEQLLNSLPDKERAPVSASINQFGFTIVQKIYSKNWQRRKQGFEDLQAYLENINSGEATSVLPETLKLIRKGLGDKAYSVYRSALLVLKYLIKDFVSKHKMIKSSSGIVAERTYGILMTRTGDSVHDSRFRSDTIEFVLDILKTADRGISTAYTTCIIRPFQATGASRIDEGHCEIVERIVEEIGAPNVKYGLDEGSVCSFAMSCTQHTDAEVRQVGARLMVHMYKHANKTKVRSFLPSESSTTVAKNPLLKALFDEFDKIDRRGGKSKGRSPSAKTIVKPKRSASTGELKKLQKQNDDLKKQLARSSSNAEKSSQLKPKAILKKPASAKLAKKKPASPRTATTAKKQTPSTAPSAKPSPIGKKRTAVSATPSQKTAAKPERSKSARTIVSVAANDKLCPFCGETNESFNEAGLDEHYLKTCPMLKKCVHCKQMYEISTLKAHWLSECPNKSKFQQCSRCQEPILNEEYAKHSQMNSCPPQKAKSKASRCVLCHKDVFPDNDTGWRKHLIGYSGCSANPRKLLGIGAIKKGKKKDGPTVPVLKLY